MKRNQKGKTKTFAIDNKIQELPLTATKSRQGSKGGAKIINRGSDNNFPYFLQDIVNGSSTLKSVINSKANYVSYGDIITDDSVVEKLMNDLNADYNYYELLKRVAIDRFTFGYGFILEVLNKGERFLYHLDASKVAYAYDKNLEQPEYVWVSEDWNDTSLPKNKPVEYSLYPEYMEDEDGIQRRVIEVKNYAPSSKDYPLPEWSGAIYDAQVESLIGQYNASTFENGVTLSSILMFDFGHVTDDTELDKIKRKLERQIKGTSGQRAGKSLIVPKSGDVDKPEYVTYPIQKKGSYLNLQKLVENNIVKACSWFRSLAGLESAGSLGNNQQLKNEWELAERLITNEQHIITEAIFKALEIEVEFSFNNSSPFSYASEININEILTENEKRELMGYSEGETTAQRIALNGAQVSSMVEVVKAYNEDLISRNAAIQTLVVGFNLQEEEAEKFLE